MADQSRRNAAHRQLHTPHPVTYQTDKGENGYVPTYKGLAMTMRQDPAICEIGVFQGGSLVLWQDLFPNAAVIVGVDREAGSLWPPGTVKVVEDQQSPTLPDQLLAVLASEAPGHRYYDLIVDDASHEGQLTYKTLQHLWELVAPGGYYVIEDWCVWNGHHGDRWDQSMLNVAMMLLKFFDAPDTEIHFVTYQYGMIIIRKKGEVGDTPGDR